MLFIENRRGVWIKAHNSRSSSYIRKFNIWNTGFESFFLRSQYWDKFSKWMNTNYPKIVIELEYYALEE